MNEQDLQSDREVMEGTTGQNPCGDHVQLQNSGPNSLFGPLAPIRISGLMATASYQTTQNALKPITYSLYMQVVHICAGPPDHVQ
jgi:hypothetical protein